MKHWSDIKNFFLFQRAPGQDWTTGRKVGLWLWTAGWLLLAAAGITGCSLLLAIGDYGLGICRTYFAHPLILLLNFLPVALVLALLYFAVGRAWIAFLGTSVLFLGFSIGNYFKLLFRDDPILFADMLILKEAGNMAANYDLALDKKLVTCLLLVAAGTVLLFFCVRAKPHKWVRLGGAAASIAVAACLAGTYLDEGLYNKTAHYEYLENQWSATQQYMARGFIYPFLHSIEDALPNPPEGYDENRAAAHLAAYSDADIPEDQKVNIIGIMLEAYNDFSKYPQLQLTDGVYGAYHALEAESYTGDLTTNIFAGGTIDTERAFLTGYAELENYRSATNSYVWYFKSQGYQALGDHPCFAWFYNRQNVNLYLGFDQYRFVEDHYGQFTGGGVAWDGIFFPELLDSCRTAMAEEAPLFSFSVTYQGHGPYDTTACWWGAPEEFLVNHDSYTPEQQNIMANYFGSLADTGNRLSAFVDELRAMDEPVVLVVFGDHNPWMGDGNSVYEALGISFDLATEEGFHNYYDTRYLIWANDAAKAALGFDFVGQGPDLGPYFLMSHLFDLCGWEGPAFMQASRQLAAHVPVLSVTGRYVEEGRLTDTLTPENAALADDYEFMTYYWSRNFAYGELLE